MPTLDDGLEGKSALVTGAARGIGRGIAEVLLDHGVDVALNDVDGGTLAATVDDVETDTDRTVTGVEADVADPAGADRAVREAADALGGLDVLVNNAAVVDPGEYAAITPEEWGHVLGVNLDGVHYCCGAAVERMDGGAIVNISSIAGQGVSVLGGAHYTAAKWGVIGLTKHVARECAPAGIRANAVCPGPTDSERIRELTDGDDRSRVAETVPLGRWGRPEDVGAAVAFLASDAAAFVTGTALTVDGGFTLG
jgi:3-oxoacyl-[acyl-carrier protein] reductase